MIIDKDEWTFNNICNKYWRTSWRCSKKFHSIRCRYDADRTPIGFCLGMAPLLPSWQISKKRNGWKQWSGKQSGFSKRIFWVWFYLLEAIRALVRTFVSLSYIRVAMRKDVGRFESINWLAGGFHFAVRASTHGAAESTEAETNKSPWRFGNTTFRSRGGNTYPNAGFRDSLSCFFWSQYHC